MKHCARTFWVTVVVMSLGLLLMGTSPSAADVFFEDSFTGAALDSTKWNSGIATSGLRFCPTNWTLHHTYGSWQDVSAVPCYGSTQPAPYGAIAVADGTASFSSGYNRTFPYVVAGPPSRLSPFPDAGDFALEIRMKYNSIQGNGDGISVFFSENTDPAGQNPPSPSGQGIYGIWADSRGLFGGGKTFSLYSPDAYVYHDYKLEYLSGKYSQYVDGNLVSGPNADSRRPNALWMGNPVHTAWGLSDWSDFTIDHIRVTVPEPVCIQPPAGIVGWWPGDGNAYAMLAGSAGTVQGGATFAPGKVGQAFSLDGSGAFVDVGNAPALQVSSNDFTIDTWVLFEALSHPPGTTLAPAGDMSIVDKMSAAFVNIDGWRLIKQDDNRFWFCLGGKDSNRCGDPAFTIFSRTVAQTGVWYHVAAVKNAEGMSLYVNGVLEDSRSPLPDFLDTNSTNLLIGSQVAELARLNGLVDEVELFNRALSAQEIQSIFTAGRAGKCRSNYVPVAVAGPDQTVEAASCFGASVMLDGSASLDPDGDSLTYTWSENGVPIAAGITPLVTLPLGTHAIMLTVDDGRGGTSTGTVTIRVADTITPVLTVLVSPNVLWPPNHEYVKVVPAVTVQDVCVETTVLGLVSATSSEPDNGLGDGDTANDIVINADGSLSLRAERSGTGSGRVYTITYRATDAGGNSATAVATVTVPHDRP